MIKRIKLEELILQFIADNGRCLNCGHDKSEHYMSYEEAYGRWRLTCPLKHLGHDSLIVTYYYART